MRIAYMDHYIRHRPDEIVNKIARLGAYKPTKKSKPPGIKTTWLGFQAFTFVAEMYHSVCQQKLKAN